MSARDDAVLRRPQPFAIGIPAKIRQVLVAVPAIGFLAIDPGELPQIIDPLVPQIGVRRRFFLGTAMMVAGAVHRDDVVDTTPALVPRHEMLAGRRPTFAERPIHRHVAPMAEPALSGDRRMVIVHAAIIARLADAPQRAGAPDRDRTGQYRRDRAAPSPAGSGRKMGGGGTGIRTLG